MQRYGRAYRGFWISFDEYNELAAPLHGEEEQPHSARAMNYQCRFCEARMWLEEKLSTSNDISPQFSFCCCKGKVVLEPWPTTCLLFFTAIPAADKAYLVLATSSAIFENTTMHFEWHPLEYLGITVRLLNDEFYFIITVNFSVRIWDGLRNRWV